MITYCCNQITWHNICNNDYYIMNSKLSFKMGDWVFWHCNQPETTNSWLIIVWKKIPLVLFPSIASEPIYLPTDTHLGQLFPPLPAKKFIPQSGMVITRHIDYVLLSFDLSNV